jgi:prepilin signal peptidase PulO-like enzyme (type II secretory pathway)
LDIALLRIICVAVLGAVVGSFLNVVIFRLPRGLSITRPPWSFCPDCAHRIRPYDNVPILSWFRLRGRCRDCAAPIAIIYPLIEICALLLFVMVWDALFIGQCLPGVGDPARDWPMAAAFVMLFAGLLATAGMDLESYSIDIRISVFGMVVGVACHAVWGMPEVFIRPPVGVVTGTLPPALCLIGVAMGLAWVATRAAAAVLRGGRVKSVGPDANGENQESLRPWPQGGRRREGAESDSSPSPPSPVVADTAQAAEAVSSPVPAVAAGTGLHTAAIAVLCLAVAVIVVWQVRAPDYRFLDSVPAAGERGFVAGFLLMLVLILASMTPRPADAQIVEEIESQRHEARPTAWRELAGFIPALALGLAVFLWLRREGRLAATWDQAIIDARQLGVFAPHLAGALPAAAGLIFSAALGWSVRILGTLAFRKEAFGTGDIYILAAIGAAAGLWATVFSFFLAAILALIGVLALVLRKSSRAIPFGPWLAMGAFATLWLQDTLLGLFGRAGSALWSMLCGESPWGLGG